MGPLNGIRVIEMAGIGPAPFCGMLLADLGAEVIRIDRLSPSGLGVDFAPEHDLLNRGKRSIAVDLKAPEGLEVVRRLIDQADALVEGFRPGVMEKLGLGPERFEISNPRLVFGRMTGWGQSGPLAAAAGHDINYIAITGALHAIGREGAPPTVPLNLVGDFGGGSLYLALGILAAIIEAGRSGRGQVVDGAIVDGTANLLTFAYGMYQAGQATLQRGRNLIDSGAPFYDVYKTRDGRHVSVGAVEPKFFHILCQGMGLAVSDLPPQYDRSRWPELRAIFATRFLEKTSDEWCAALEGTDACFAPVLDLAEASAHPHNAARVNHQKIAGVTHPSPAPRFSRTPGEIVKAAPAPGADTATILRDYGFDADETARLASAGVIPSR